MVARRSLIIALFLAFSVPVEAAQSGMDRVKVLLESGTPTEAITALRQLVRDEPANAAAHNMLGSLLNSGGNYAEALPHAEAAARLDPGNVPYRYNRGVVRAEHGRFVEAVADFDAALAADPNQPYAWLERGAAKLSLGDVAGARADWRTAATRDPKLIWTHWYEATGDFVEGRFVEAAAGFDRVAAAEPGFVPAKLWRAIAHARAGTPLAVEEPGSADWPAPAVRFLRKKVDEAALLMTAGEDRVSGDKRRTAEAYFFIAQRALIDGDTAAARDHLRRALAIPSPRHVWRIAAEGDLNQLEDR
ncbi:MAG: tetratricopeptide repeat protein [Sphingomicrobium sp.]